MAFFSGSDVVVGLTFAIGGAATLISAYLTGRRRGAQQTGSEEKPEIVPAGLLLRLDEETRVFLRHLLEEYDLTTGRLTRAIADHTDAMARTPTPRARR